MSIDKHVFHLVDPCLSSIRLLYDFEKQSLIEEFTSSSKVMYTISANDWRCVTLGAKVNDIICIKNHISNIYRKVI
jgi:hypothetical protein